MYHYYNPNPEGRNVGDCSVRAVSKALCQDWDTTYWGLALEGALLRDMPSVSEYWGAYLARIGLRRYQAPDGITVGEFACENNRGVYILALSGHVVCIVDGVLYDTWDSSRELVLYYWQKG